jgi:hypothetical protein
LAAVVSGPAPSAGLVQQVEGRGGAGESVEDEAGGVTSQVAEEGTLSDVRGALAVGVAHVLLHAGAVRGGHRPDVALHHGDPGDGGVAHRVLLADGACGDRAMGERRLEGVEQVHHYIDELEKNRVRNWSRRRRSGQTRTSPACLASMLTCFGSLDPSTAVIIAAKTPCATQATTSASFTYIHAPMLPSGSAPH